MTPFRQLVLPGEVGSDELAVKRAMRAMGVPGSGGLIVRGAGSRRAGASAVKVLNHVLVSHGLKPDGIYGPEAHKIIAPHFDRWGVVLYRLARIRVRVQPPANLDTQAAATSLLLWAAKGRFRDDRGTCMAQVRSAAAGRAVWSPAGMYVHLDARWMDAILTLIEKGGTIGLFAICSDHGFDSTRGHAGGHACDISSVNGVSINSPGAAALTRSTGRLLNGLTGNLHPWQLISGGYDSRHDSTCEANCIPSAGFYGEPTLSEHCNHIHLGYE